MDDVRALRTDTRPRHPEFPVHTRQLEISSRALRVPKRNVMNPASARQLRMANTRETSRAAVRQGANCASGVEVRVGDVPRLQQVNGRKRWAGKGSLFQALRLFLVELGRRRFCAALLPHGLPGGVTGDLPHFLLGDVRPLGRADYGLLRA